MLERIGVHHYVERPIGEWKRMHIGFRIPDQLTSRQILPVPAQIESLIDLEQLYRLRVFARHPSEQAPRPPAKSIQRMRQSHRAQVRLATLAMKSLLEVDVF